MSVFKIVASTFSRSGSTESRPHFKKKLFSYIQFLDQRAVFRHIFFRQVIEKVTALADHSEQSALGMIILRIFIEMRRESIDLFGQQSDLHFRFSAVFRT